MTHSLCKSDADGMFSCFERLARTLFAPDIDSRAKLERLFEHETAEFDLNYAFLSRIDLDDGTERFEAVYGSHEMLQPGVTVPLSETYCRRTIADPDGTIAVSDAPAEGWDEDPAYERFQFERYLGTTVSVDEELYGTLCFTDTAAPDEPFVEKEKALLEMYGQWVGSVLALRDEPPVQAARTETIEERAVSSDAIDSMMDALSSPTRRLTLMMLLAETTDMGIDSLERRLDHENARIQLHHTHLPRLVNAGYIRWDTAADTISKGPKFSEVGPLVHLLAEYDTAYPE